MKTDPTQLRALKSRVAALPAEAELNLPASFVSSLVEDVEAGIEAAAALESYRAAVHRLPHGGEESIGGHAEDVFAGEETHG